MNEAAQKLASVGHEGAGPRTVDAILMSLGLSVTMRRHALQRVLGEGLPVRLRNDASGVAPATKLVEVTGTPTRDAERNVTGAVWVLRDVSDVARIEHERAKAARLESLGVLAGGLAHDFNNILMGIVGNLSLAQSMVRPDDAALSVRLTSAAAACSRARGVTNQLLTFSKGGAPVKTTASVDELVTECTRFALSGSPVAARFDISHGLWPADVDTVQIGQVVQNLVLNAMQAMPRGGSIDVSLQNVELALDSLPAQTALSPGKYVCLIIQDTGTGISPEHLGRIFDPYFTTKEKGSGLGLAISYSIVRAHGGAIGVESQLGIGTRFSIYLPASTRRVKEAAPARVESSRGRSGRVLLMDDEPLVAEVAQEMLESLGYATQVSVSGTDAIAQFRDAESLGEPFDAVILDLTVPGGMGGSEALPHIKDIRPDVPVLVTSGYADDSVLARYRDYGFDGVLPKPFAIPELRKALQDAEANRLAKASKLPLIKPGSFGGRKTPTLTQ
jgi:signal transduction histidine kinase/ActR/RegA family two-component response regulator